MGNNVINIQQSLWELTLRVSWQTNAKANWNVAKKIYGSGDPIAIMEEHGCTYLFH